MPISETQRAQRYAALIEQAIGYRSLPPAERRDAALAYLFDLAELISVEAGEDAIIAPLLDVIPFIADPTESPLFQDRRAGTTPPSESVLARASSTIDVLIAAGHLPDTAAQIVARQLVNARAGLPVEGGDARGWKRLAIWRDRLTSLKKPAGAWRTYSEFTKSLDKLDRAEVVRRALDGSLWDIRKQKSETLDAKP
ncbi:MAG: hypothetical protein JNM89_08690 [Hyphomicrobiaceae bacterium]|nr:hypothetical protein [Hyphomicrobiaceae bacterium]